MAAMNLRFKRIVSALPWLAAPIAVAAGVLSLEASLARNDALLPASDDYVVTVAQPTAQRRAL